MFSLVDTRNPTAVEGEVADIYEELFPKGNAGFVREVFAWVLDCFQGNYAEYQAVDAGYHDLEHTLQGTLCMARLLAGRHRAGVEPTVDQHLFELGLLGILLHDTGYLKLRGDTQGTGAKYTLIHVHRSCDFAERLLSEKGFKDEDVASVQSMIRCTGVNADLERIPFLSDAARMVGFSLGTADLLGQMAADDYVEKLPVLYSEFEESANFNEGNMASLGIFSSAEDLISKTPGFWEFYVFPKLQKDLGGVFEFLNDPYPEGANWYVDRVRKNIDRVKALAK